MSDRRRRVVAVALHATLVFTAGPVAALHAQTHTPTVLDAADQRAAELRARFVRAWEHADRLNLRLDSASRAKTTGPSADSIIAGSVVVRFRGTPPSPELRANVERAARAAWTMAKRTLGPSAELFSGHPVNFTQQTTGSFWGRNGYAVIGFPGRNMRWRQLRANPGAAAVTDALLDVYGSFLGARLPASVKRWATNEWIPLNANGRDEWRGMSVALATSRSSYGRRCSEGAIPDCAVALNLLNDSTADPLHDWYREDDIPALVSEYRGKDSTERSMIARCTSTRDATACLQAAALQAIAAPVSTSARFGFIAFALERGGPDAFTRMMNATGPVQDVLAATAGVPIDQLLVEWHARVISATPERTLPGPLEGATILAWTALFATLATRRRP